MPSDWSTARTAMATRAMKTTLHAPYPMCPSPDRTSRGDRKYSRLLSFSVLSSYLHSFFTFCSCNSHLLSVLFCLFGFFFFFLLLRLFLWLPRLLLVLIIANFALPVQISLCTKASRSHKVLVYNYMLRSCSFNGLYDKRISQTQFMINCRFFPR